MLKHNAIDIPSQDLKSKFNESIEFINLARSRGENVLVHCYAGISRSATIVIAYLLREYKYRLEEALAYVVAKRSIVKPNDGFYYQLVEFEREVHEPKKRRMSSSFLAWA
eukprot:TRINITY_DN2926_c0_g1_i6.p1 TRINITY_DN2926_c0_g1~~TRINITY_DN2926_c0_g1_i6.p1  ORF type:complete len:110 (+),score=16.36 TRINITY_DN2926_c0_g1_i6:398-727(+)